MLKVDLHSHTSKSSCGIYSFDEMVKEAARKKIKIFGITDHSDTPAVPEHYFAIGNRLPKKYKKTRILFGCEANIIDKKGNLELSNKIMRRLDFIIAGLHGGNSKTKGIKANTEAMINAIKIPEVKIISHPTFFGEFEVNISKVSETACRYNKLLEINSSHFMYESKFKKESIPAIQKMIKITQEKKHKLIINSDAHTLEEIGNDERLMKWKKKLGFKHKDIINNDIDAVKEYFKV